MMKIIQAGMFVGLLLVAAVVFAQLRPGFYLGGEAGETNSHYNAYQVGLHSSDTRTQGFTGRVFGGYQFNPFIAVETGFLLVRPTRFLHMNGTSSRGKVNERSVDLLARATLPIRKVFAIYVRYGVSLLDAKGDSHLRGMSTNYYQNKSQRHFRPLYGFGAIYHISRRFDFQGGWFRIHRHRAIPPVDFFSIGVNFFPFRKMDEGK
jgi:OmpA-OmpF porin, OOP family